MASAGTKQPTRDRIAIAALVFLLHLCAAIVLVRAFAPQLPGEVARQAIEAFDIAIPLEPKPVPRPEKSPAASERALPDPAGASAPEGRKLPARDVAVPKPKVVLATPDATISGGAGQQGSGSGAGGIGQGSGAGAFGSGSGGGGGGAAKAVKIAGDINSARDYPKATRELRLGGSVTIALTVSVEGRVTGCRVLRPSRDAEADLITCRLATERFRFRPARDRDGRAVAAVFGWQQRWFAPPAD